MKVFEQNILITNKEIDENEHVNNVMYVQWMNDIAIAHSSNVGDTVAYQRKNNYMWVAKSHTIDYIRSAYEGDTVSIKTWASEYKKTATLREYEFYNQKNELLAKAKTVYVFLNFSTLRPTKIPEEVASLYY